MTESAKQLAGQGLGYLLFVLACGVIIWLFLNSRADNKANADKLGAIAEERLKEAREDTAALQTSAASTATSNSATASANIALAAAIEKMSTALADILKDNEHGRELWNLRFATVTENQRQILELLGKLSEKVTAGGAK